MDDRRLAPHTGWSEPVCVPLNAWQHARCLVALAISGSCRLSSPPPPQTASPTTAPTPRPRCAHRSVARAASVRSVTGWGEPRPGADVGWNEASPGADVGRGEPSRSADAGGVSRGPAQTWASAGRTFCVWTPRQRELAARGSVRLNSRDGGQHGRGMSKEETEGSPGAARRRTRTTMRSCSRTSRRSCASRRRASASAAAVGFRA
jgi:hypothetical protein